MKKLLTLLIAGLLISSSSLWGQTTNMTISAQSQWESTGVNITSEMTVTIEATGEWCGAPWSCYGPEGTGGIAPSAFLAPSLSSGGLVGKVGNNAPFLVGSSCSFDGQDHGTATLYLAFNDDLTGYYNNSGTLDVTITTTEDQGGIELVGQYTSKPAYDLKVRGDYAYVTGLNTRELNILNISDPTNPSLVGTYTSTANEVREVALIGSYAYIACSWAGFEVIDISDPSSPTKVGPTHSGSGVAVAFEFANGYGFLANRESGIRVFDVSDPANPAYVTTYSTSRSNAWASSITISGNYLYIGIEHSPNGFEVFDISNPAVQNKVGTISGTNSVYGIAKDGNYVYHSGQWENTFNIVDISDPSNPVRLGTGFPTHGDPWGIAISGDLAFLGERGYGLQILDISDKANPALLDEYATGGDPHWGIAVVGDYVYLADGPGGVKVFSTTGIPWQNNPPVAVLTAYFNATGVVFDASLCSDPDGNITLYEFDFEDDGQNDMSLTRDEFETVEYLLPYNYQQSNNHFTAVLTVTDQYNESSRSSVDIYRAGFEMGRDNYRFSNRFQWLEVSDEEIESFVEQTYGTNMPWFLSEWLADQILSMNWYGRCSGMASSSCTYYLDEIAKPFSGTVYSWDREKPGLLDAIFGYHLRFNIAYVIFLPGSILEDPRAKFERFQESLLSDEPMVMTLHLVFGHAVTATGIIENANNTFSLKAYDNNNPSSLLSLSAEVKNGTWEVNSDSYKDVRSFNFIEGWRGQDILGTDAILGAFASELGAIVEGAKHRITIKCPVDVLLINDSGARIGMKGSTEYDEIPGSHYSADSLLWTFDVPNDGQYSLHIFGKAQDSAVTTIYTSNPNWTVDLSMFEVPLTASSHTVIMLGQGVQDTVASADMDGDSLFESGFVATNWSWQTNVETMLTHGSLSGTVSSSGLGLIGVPVDLYDSLGTLIKSAVTNDNGHYDFGALENGDYTVAIVTPLGLVCEEESQQIVVVGLNHRCNFALSQLEITPQQRSRGYWAHQLHKALQNKPKDYTLQDFADFASLINVHFNQNQVNPVDFYSVPQPANQSDSLEVLGDLLHMRNTGEDDPLLKRLAKSELMALMLNVVSGKVSQTHEISADGRTVSQLITYCDMLINDEITPPDNNGCPGHGSPWFRYIYASFMLVKANLGLTVPSGMIPEDVIQIAYKQQHVETLPTEFALYQNYPNPFNPTTEISFALPNAANVKLEIFNIMGQKVATPIDRHIKAGNHSVIWDGSKYASGAYFYRIEAGEFIETKKMILLK